MPKLKWKYGIFALAAACLLNACLNPSNVWMWIQTSMIVGAIGLSVA